MKRDRFVDYTDSLFVFNAAIPDEADCIAFFDQDTSRIYILDTLDYMRNRYDNCFIIRKLSDFNDLGNVFLANIDAFTAKFPESEIEKYISAPHSPKVTQNLDKYIASYIHLYKYYKSLGSLTRNNFSEFIDSFIENCFMEKTDHPGTICYFDHDIHKIFKLRKTVFEIFKPYLNNYATYTYIFTLQNYYKYSDRELRKVRKELKRSSAPKLVYPVEKKSSYGLKLLA